MTACRADRASGFRRSATGGAGCDQVRLTHSLSRSGPSREAGDGGARWTPSRPATSFAAVEGRCAACGNGALDGRCWADGWQSMTMSSMGHDGTAVSWASARSAEEADGVEDMDMASMGTAMAGCASPVVHRARASTASSPAHRLADSGCTRVLAMARDASPRWPPTLGIL